MPNSEKPHLNSDGSNYRFYAPDADWHILWFGNPEYLRKKAIRTLDEIRRILETDENADETDATMSIMPGEKAQQKNLRTRTSGNA